MRVEQSPWRIRYSTSLVRKRVFAGTRTAPMRATANRRRIHSGELLSQRHTLSPGATPSAISPFAASSTPRAISAKDWRTVPKTRADLSPQRAAARAGSSPTGVRPSQRSRWRAGSPSEARSALSSPRVIRPPLPPRPTSVPAAAGRSRRPGQAADRRRPPASTPAIHPAFRPFAAADRSVYGRDILL